MKTGIVLVTALITVGAIGTGGFFLWDALSGGDNRAKQRETQQHTYDHAVTRVELKLDSGKSLEANKHYKVAGWASVNPQQGKPVWDVLADYLRSGKTSLPYGSNVTLKGVDGNPGIAG